MLVQEPVQAAIWHCLNHYAYGDATFLAERLLSEVDTDDSLFLLATCYYRSGKLSQAYDILHAKGLRTAQNKFLMARCCTELSKYSEAETILNGGNLIPRKELTLEDIQSEFGDSTSFALQLLSKIYSQTERTQKAVDADRKALRLNPFLWKSFESLCNKGDSPDPNKVFSTSNLDSFSHCHGSNTIISFVNQHQQQSTNTPANTFSTPISSAVVIPNAGMETPIQNPAGNPVPQIITPSPAVPMDVGPGDISIASSVCTPIGNTTVYSTRFMSGISALSVTSDSEVSFAPLSASNNQRRNNLMPPPIGPRKHPHVFSRLQETPTTFAFGVLPRGQVGSGGNRLPESPFATGAAPALKLDFSSPSFSVLSPCLPSLQQSETALANATNTEPKLNKRSLMSSSKENPLKPNNLNQSGNSSNVAPNVRRSTRLFGSTQSVKENSGKAAKNRGTPKSPSRKSKPRMTRTPQSDLEKNEKNKLEQKIEKPGEVDKPVLMTAATSTFLGQQALVIQKQSVDGLMHLLRQFGTAYQEMARFNCRKALQLLDAIPSHHRTSGWVLGLVGKGYFELGEYKEAKRFFQEIRDRDPHRLDFMEYYSTSLWHLQEEVELSALAQELTRIDKFSAHAWCAAGNCFSHQKEHENAIKFFQRAVQVDPSFAYAYTLLGHEYVMIEELDKAVACFRTAVRIEPRHYNAWYGIGLTYYKQERFQLAEMYYRKALAINPQSPVLMCHVAVVQHALQKTERALDTLNTAIKAAPKNPLCKFERASILFSSERYEEALEELNDLKELLPKESPVYFLIGKVHNKLNNTHMALMHFSWAMDLDPKGANSQIKDALDPTLNRAAQEENNGVHPADDEMTGPEDFPDVSESFHPGASATGVAASTSQESITVTPPPVEVTPPTGGGYLNDVTPPTSSFNDGASQ